MLRVPYRGGVSPAVVSTIAITLAGLASAATIVGSLKLLGDPYRHVGTGHLAPFSTLAALVLALAVARAPGVAAMFARSVLGGAPAGFVGAVATCVTLRVTTGMPFDAFSDVGLGMLFGMAFGCACSIPALELHWARRDRADSVTDVQIVNTSAWLACVAAPGAVLASEREWALAAFAIAVLAVATGAAAGVRWWLRRRWLRRVFAGRDHEWAAEPNDADETTVPVLDLLCAWSDEHRLVRVLPAAGAAYRSADRRVVVARVAPASPH